MTVIYKKLSLQPNYNPAGGVAKLGVYQDDGNGNFVLVNANLDDIKGGAAIGTAEHVGTLPENHYIDAVLSPGPGDNVIARVMVCGSIALSGGYVMYEALIGPGGKTVMCSGGTIYAAYTVNGSYQSVIQIASAAELQHCSIRVDYLKDDQLIPAEDVTFSAPTLYGTVVPDVNTYNLHQNQNGGFEGGANSSAINGAAVGNSAEETAGGGAVGAGAKATNGFAGGNAAQETLGGSATGADASAANGGASGNTAVTTEGGSVGSNTVSQRGFAGGQGASTVGGNASGQAAGSDNGGASGYGATTTDGAASGKLSRSTTGGASGHAAETFAGSASGENSESDAGGAAGKDTATTSGAAVGNGAESTNGAAVGENAKALGSNRVQLGTGVNATDNTLQYLGIQLVDNTGQIPAAILNNAPSGGGASMIASGRISNAPAVVYFDAGGSNAGCTVSNQNGVARITFTGVTKVEAFVVESNTNIGDSAFLNSRRVNDTTYDVDSVQGATLVSLEFFAKITN